MNTPTSFPEQKQPVKIRRTAEQWQSILEAYEHSGLTVQDFCAQHKVAYSSFAKWRHKVSTHRPTPMPQALSFIELPPMESGLAHTPWRIELELGGGVVLRLTR
ncbi:MAG: IS66 family insertion sequence element accessory protein TnpB [Patescibacteria group bacterium]|jgi:hypothetical protein